MYRPLLVFESTISTTLCYVYTLNVSNNALHDVSVMYKMFHTIRVNVHALALNLNIQYLTLL